MKAGGATLCLTIAVALLVGARAQRTTRAAVICDSSVAFHRGIGPAVDFLTVDDVAEFHFGEGYCITETAAVALFTDMLAPLPGGGTKQSRFRDSGFYTDCIQEPGAITNLEVRLSPDLDLDPVFETPASPIYCDSVGMASPLLFVDDDVVHMHIGPFVTFEGPGLDSRTQIKATQRLVHVHSYASRHTNIEYYGLFIFFDGDLQVEGMPLWNEFFFGAECRRTDGGFDGLEPMDNFTARFATAYQALSPAYHKVTFKGVGNCTDKDFPHVFWHLDAVAVLFDTCAWMDFCHTANPLPDYDIQAPDLGFAHHEELYDWIRRVPLGAPHASETPEVVILSAGANIHHDSAFFMSGPAGPLVSGWSTAHLSNSQTVVVQANTLDDSESPILAHAAYQHVISFDFMRTVLVALGNITQFSLDLGIPIDSGDVFSSTNRSNAEFAHITDNYVTQGLAFIDNVLAWSAPPAQEPVCPSLATFDFGDNFSERALGARCSAPDHTAVDLVGGAPWQLMDIAGTDSADEFCADILAKTVPLVDIVTFYTNQTLPVTPPDLEIAFFQFIWHISSPESKAAGFGFLPCLSLAEAAPLAPSPTPPPFRRGNRGLLGILPPSGPTPVPEPFVLPPVNDTFTAACAILRANPDIDDVIVDDQHFDRPLCGDPDFGGGGGGGDKDVSNNVRGTSTFLPIVFGVMGGFAVCFFAVYFLRPQTRRAQYQSQTYGPYTTL